MALKASASTWYAANAALYSLYLAATLGSAAGSSAGRGNVTPSQQDDELPPRAILDGAPEAAGSRLTVGALGLVESARHPTTAIDAKHRANGFVGIPYHYARYDCQVESLRVSEPHKMPPLVVSLVIPSD